MSFFLPIPSDLLPEEPEFLRILNSRLQSLAEETETKPETVTAVSGSSFSGSHKNRLQQFLPEKLPIGTMYFETDRTLYYIVVSDPANPQKQIWRYVAGQMRGTLSPNQKPTDLNDEGDVGMLFFATDFAHLYRWNGTAWRYAVEHGDPGSGFVQDWLVTPNDSGVWALCDGSTATRSKNGGTTESFTTPNLVGAYRKGASSYSGTVVAAAAGTITGQTGDESAHTHGTGTLAVGASGSTTGTTAGGAAVAASGHTHSLTGATGAGSAHHHSAGTLAVSAAEPAHVDVMPYMRL